MMQQEIEFRAISKKFARDLKWNIKFIYLQARFPIIFSKVKFVKKFYTRRKVIEYP